MASTVLRPNSAGGYAWVDQGGGSAQTGAVGLVTDNNDGTFAKPVEGESTFSGRFATPSFPAGAVITGMRARGRGQVGTLSLSIPNITDNGSTSNTLQGPASVVMGGFGEYSTLYAASKMDGTPITPATIASVYTGINFSTSDYTLTERIMEMYLDVNYQVPPTPSALAFVAGRILTGRPVPVSWTHGQVDGQAQTQAIVRVFTKASFEANVDVFSTAGNVYDSGTLTQAGASHAIPSLPAGDYYLVVLTSSGNAAGFTPNSVARTNAVPFTVVGGQSLMML